MTTTIKAAGAADFLGLIPSMLGYVPQESLIAVLFAGTRSQGAMRFDLPAPEDAQSVAVTIAGMVMRVEGVDSVAVIAWSQTRTARESYPLLDAVTFVMDTAGFRLSDSLSVGTDGWASVVTDADAIHSLAEIPTPELGFPVATSQTATVELPTPDPEMQANIDAVPEEVILGALEMADLPDLIEPMLTPVGEDELGMMGWATLRWILGRPSTRDIMMMQAVDDKEQGFVALEAQLAWDDGAEYPAELAQRMWGQGKQPNPKRLERMLELARWTAAYTPAGQRGGALAMAGWVSWALGRSSQAEVYAGMAEADEPGHGLAGIMRSFVSAGHLPDWAFAKRGA